TTRRGCWARAAFSSSVMACSFLLSRRHLHDSGTARRRPRVCFLAAAPTSCRSPCFRPRRFGRRTMLARYEEQGLCPKGKTFPAGLARKPRPAGTKGENRVGHHLFPATGGAIFPHVSHRNLRRRRRGAAAHL